MASTLTLVIMVLPVTLLFLQETYALNVVQERRDPLECDRRHRRALCAYREGCSCHPRAPLGGWSRLHYRFENGRCSRENLQGYHRCNICRKKMVSAQTLIVMLLPAVLFFLQEAHGSVVVEERDIVCDRLLGACRYRD
ncbi:hypothetical protein MTO96_040799, partial [Rhipicephalus appendiculatus]